MKRGLLIAVGGSAVVIVGLSGCSSGDGSPAASSSSTSSESSESSSAAASTSASAAADTKVTIDGEDQQVTGSVTCTTVGDSVAITIGDPTSGIAVRLTTGDAPTVKQVGLGNVNGAVLGYSEGAVGSDAKAEKTSDGYEVTGNATGIDMANPLTPVTKPFEIDVTCP